MPWAKAWGAVDARGKFKYPFPPTVFYEMAVRQGAGGRLHTGCPPHLAGSLAALPCGWCRALQTRERKARCATSTRGGSHPAHHSAQPYSRPPARLLASHGPRSQNDATTSQQIKAALTIFKNNNVKADVIKARAAAAAWPCRYAVVMVREHLLSTCCNLQLPVLITPCAALPFAMPPAQVPMRPVTPDFLSQRSIYISQSQSRQIQALLRKLGTLDANGWLRYDPRKVRAMSWLLLVGVHARHRSPRVHGCSWPA